ncbi:MAG: uracil-DNA glycosylase [Bacteroidales bacterium]|nr:uracil-DNA glycosylase [Bacteroidales bacterium]
MNVKIDNMWRTALADEWEKPYFKDLTDFVRAEYASKTIFPPAKRIFAAFDACPFDKVKVVILGQDPYHGPGQANGLCFSVAPGVALPPSLLNIFKEMKSDLGFEGPIPAVGDLDYLAEQGVLLLNATLTVEAHRAGSHQNHGWETLTDAAIARLNELRSGIVFLLWGSYAIRKEALIDRSRHLVLTSPHPSPLSAHRGFFGNHHFSTANQYLQSQGLEPIRWL